MGRRTGEEWTVSLIPHVIANQSSRKHSDYRVVGECPSVVPPAGSKASDQSATASFVSDRPGAHRLGKPQAGRLDQGDLGRCGVLRRDRT